MQTISANTYISLTSFIYLTLFFRSNTFNVKRRTWDVVCGILYKHSFLNANLKKQSVTQNMVYFECLLRLGVKRKNVVNNADKSSLRAPWQNGPSNIKHTEQHKTRRTPSRNSHSELAMFLCFSDFSIFMFLWFLKWYFPRNVKLG